jgi:peroxiredoxin
MRRFVWIAGCVGLLVSSGVTNSDAPAFDGDSIAAAATNPDGPDAASSTATGREATESKGMEFRDLEGKPHRPTELGKSKAVVIIFVLHDCPISNKYAPEIQRLADGFGGKGIRFYVVQVDPELSLEKAQQHANEYRYKLPILIDRKHELVHRFKATTAPEAFVIGDKGKVLYHGRIDDRYAAVGKPRQQVDRQDLRLALESILAEKPIEVAETKAIGCYIPELDGE